MIAIPAMALIVPAGGARAATTQSSGQVAAHAIAASQIAGHGMSARQLSAATITWHKLALINGWKPDQSNTLGNPAYAIKGGVVYVSGSLRQPAGTSDLFAHLPAAARQAHDIFIPTYTFAGSSGWVEIDPKGATFAVSQPLSKSQGFTSLAAISYPRTS